MKVSDEWIAGMGDSFHACCWYVPFLYGLILLYSTPGDKSFFAGRHLWDVKQAIKFILAPISI